MLAGNCLLKIFEGDEIHKNPILQIVKIVGNKKLTLSDGNSSVIALLLTSNLYDIVESKKIKLYDLIELIHYVADKKRKQLIITQLRKVNECNNIIGQPSDINQDNKHNSVDLLKNSNPLLRKISQIQSCMIKNWYIVCKIVNKYPVKVFKDKNKTSKRFFSFIVRDNDESTAKVICFDESLVDMLYDDIKINWVYKIINLQPKEANTKYNATTCKYDLLITKNTSYEVICDDDETFGDDQMKFTLIKDVDNSKSKINIISYILSSEDIREVTTLKGRYIKRTIVVCDDSGYCIDLTLWGEHALSYIKNVNRIIKATEVQISNYRSKSLTTTFNSDVEYDPPGQRSEELICYFNDNNNIKALVNLSESEKVELFEHIIETSKEGLHNITCYVIDIPLEKPPIYFACPNTDCKNKGLISNSENKYFCERCYNVIDSPLIRYNARIKVSDFTGTIYATLIGDDKCGEILFGMSASNLFKRIITRSENEYKNMIKNLLFKEYKLRLRTKKECFNGYETFNVIIVSAIPIDYRNEVNIIYEKLMIS